MQRISKFWQGALHRAGFYRGRIDGIRGPLTVQAIKDCRDWQIWLNSKGFNAGNVDGWPGYSTVTSIRAFQIKAGVAADGVVGPKTRNARNHYTSAVRRVINRVIDVVAKPAVGAVYRAWPDLVIHYSASPTGSAAEINAWHRARGWKKGGYHAVIRRDGVLETGDMYPNLLRTSSEIGAHILRRNYRSYGVCFISQDGNLTTKQWETGIKYIRELVSVYRVGNAGKCDGHRFFPGQATSCPGVMDIAGLKRAAGVS